MNKKIQPLLKWAGGKRKLLQYILPKVPDRYNCYLEPFIGGASVLMAISPKKAIVSDLNDDLINTYLETRDFPEDLINVLKKYNGKHSEDFYYQIRNLDRLESFQNLSDLEKAARFIYLNHTCYNGLYRVNSLGQYNTPIGRYKNPKIVDEQNIRLVSEYFKNNDIRFICNDYKKTLDLAREGDFVYLDPPYDPISDSASFTMYTKDGFDKEDQKRLKKECDRLNSIGALFMQSNSDTNFIRELYKDYFIETIEAPRNINSKGDKRKNVNEVLITNYKVGEFDDGN